MNRIRRPGRLTTVAGFGSTLNLAGPIGASHNTPQLSLEEIIWDFLWNADILSVQGELQEFVTQIKARCDTTCITAVTEGDKSNSEQQGHFDAVSLRSDKQPFGTPQELGSMI